MIRDLDVDVTGVDLGLVLNPADVRRNVYIRNLNSTVFAPCACLHD